MERGVVQWKGEWSSGKWSGPVESGVVQWRSSGLVERGLAQ